jgi:hypothetical protein
MKTRYFSSVILLAMLFGCSNQGGSEFAGKWVNVKSEKRSLEIQRNGDSFIVRETAPGIATGELQTKNIPAVLKDGMLQMNNGWGVSSLAVDKSSGHLTNGQAEYKRAN